MPNRLSTLDYVVQNFPSRGDTMLDGIRREAQDELAGLRSQNRVLLALVRGQLYRGVLIYSLPAGGSFILAENGGPEGVGTGQYDFKDEAEAEAFIDACLSMSGRLVGVLA